MTHSLRRERCSRGTFFSRDWARTMHSTGNSLGIMLALAVCFAVNLTVHAQPKVAAGIDHSLYLPSVGAAYGFGNNFYGELAVGDTDRRLIPSDITAISLHCLEIVDVVAGAHHSIFLSRHGHAFASGQWIPSGGVGGRTLGDYPSLINSTNLGGKAIVRAAGGRGHSVLIALDGSIFTMGYNEAGQLGHGDTENRFDPVQVESAVMNGHEIVDVAAGLRHTLLLSEEGSVFAFGNGSNGRLGTGDSIDRHEPVLLDHPNLDEHRIVAVAAGHAHSVLLSEDGTVFTFGVGSHGRLGNGRISGNTLLPTPIEAGDLADHDFKPTAIAAGGSQTFVVTEDGALFGFGNRFGGRLGIGDSTTDTSSPVRVGQEELAGRRVVSVATNSALQAGSAVGHTLVSTDDRAIFTFGHARDGRIGHGDDDNRMVPALLMAPPLHLPCLIWLADEWRDGWSRLDWFGWFRLSGPWMNHLEHGWIHYVGTDTGSIHFYDAAHEDWYWTRKTAYPWLYWFGAVNAWLYYEIGGDAGERRFYHPDQERWIPEDQLGG